VGHKSPVPDRRSCGYRHHLQKKITPSALQPRHPNLSIIHIPRRYASRKQISFLTSSSRRERITQDPEWIQNALCNPPSLGAREEFSARCTCPSGGASNQVTQLVLWDRPIRELFRHRRRIHGRSNICTSRCAQWPINLTLAVSRSSVRSILHVRITRIAPASLKPCPWLWEHATQHRPRGDGSSNRAKRAALKGFSHRSSRCAPPRVLPLRVRSGREWK
jgi:hypothetical protein